MGTMTSTEFAAHCDEFTFDIVLGSDGNPQHNIAGTHWDCWTSSRPAATTTRNPNILGKHMGACSWIQHLAWLNPHAQTRQQRLNVRDVIVVDN
jgi:hypothetical protein